jgi:tRNA modification GTPase
VEAVLDFSDEDDVSEATDISPRAAALARTIAAVAGGPTTERLRDGVRVVLAGPPNSGKSTLFNALVEREAAIVSPIAGTTRDRIEAPIAREGISYLLTDTAGLTETDDPIEAIGVARARDALASGDIVLWLGDTRPEIEALWIQARADEGGRETLGEGRDLAVSARSGSGMAELWTALGSRAAALLPRLDAVALNDRQQRLCLECAAELEAAAGQRDLILIAEHLRRARVALDRVVGVADVEAMLDGLFGRFCIGK